MAKPLFLLIAALFLIPTVHAAKVDRAEAICEKLLFADDGRGVDYEIQLPKHILPAQPLQSGYLLKEANSKFNAVIVRLDPGQILDQPEGNEYQNLVIVLTERLKNNRADYEETFHKLASLEEVFRNWIARDTRMSKYRDHKLVSFLGSGRFVLPQTGDAVIGMSLSFDDLDFGRTEARQIVESLNDLLNGDSPAKKALN